MCSIYLSLSISPSGCIHIKLAASFRFPLCQQSIFPSLLPSTVLVSPLHWHNPTHPAVPPPDSCSVLHPHTPPSMPLPWGCSGGSTGLASQHSGGRPTFTMVSHLAIAQTCGRVSPFYTCKHENSMRSRIVVQYVCFIQSITVKPSVPFTYGVYIDHK